MRNEIYFVIWGLLEKILIHIVLSMQVSITLIATGFKRQDEPEGRASKVTLVEQLLGPPNLDVILVLTFACNQRVASKVRMADARPPQKAAWWRSQSSFDEEDLLASLEFDCPAMLPAPALHLYNMPHS